MRTRVSGFKNMFVAAVSLMFLSALGEERDGVKIELTNSATRYELRAFFQCRARDMDTLKHVIFDYRHVKKIVKSASSIDMLKSRDNQHALMYRYKGVLWEANTSYERRLETDRDAISFKMLSFESKGRIPVPRLLSSSGYYRLTAKDNIYQVDFYQTADIEPIVIPEVYFNRIKNECFNYLTDLKAYIDAYYFDDVEDSADSSRN